MTYKSILYSISLVGLFGCAPPNPKPAAVHALAGSKVLPPERWNSAQKGRISSYPPLARLAGISGDLVMLLEINELGQVIGGRRISGPPQLAAPVERFARTIRFSPEPTDRPGPWVFSITARFDLTGKAGWAPTGQEIVLETVSMPDPSFR